MGEALPEGVSRQEFGELSTAVGELREALDELRQARTAPERREAQGEVREARADLAATARELGLDPKRLEKAASDAKLADERERLRPLLIELLDEELEATGDDALDGLKDAVEDKGGGAPPKPDSAPNMGHWSERGLSELFGGGK